MLPGATVYMFLGTTLPSLADAMSGNFHGGYLTLTMLIVGCCFGLFAVIYISIVVKRYLKENMNLDCDSAEMRDSDKQRRYQEFQDDCGDD